MIVLLVKNNYIEYMNEGDEYADLSPQEYLSERLDK